MDEEYHYDFCYSKQPVHSEILLQAFKELESILGIEACQELVNDLHVNGIFLENSAKLYSLLQIEQALIQIFSENGTDLLMTVLLRSCEKNKAVVESTV
jgi:hypothetical protein